MVEIKENNSSPEKIYAGDIVKVYETGGVKYEYYLAVPIDNRSRIMFMTIEDRFGIWNSRGISVDDSTDFESVRKHFHGKNIEIIPKENYKMILEV